MFTVKDIRQSITCVLVIQKEEAIHIYPKEQQCLPTPTPTDYPSRKHTIHASQYNRVYLTFKTEIIHTHASLYNCVYLTFKTEILKQRGVNTHSAVNTILSTLPDNSVFNLRHFAELYGFNSSNLEQITTFTKLIFLIWLWTLALCHLPYLICLY
jgi:hypothetical protein